MLTREILQRKLLRRNLMHGGAGVHLNVVFQISVINDIWLLISELSASTVCLELFPPIQRCRNINIYGNHPHELPMICTSVAKTSHEVEIVGAKTIIFGFNNVTEFIPDRIAIATITLLPRIHGIPHPSDSCLPANDFCFFDFKHRYLPP